MIFHVQTEDSGLLNPHLFTHLFHEGVIVSTRKLVYDAGSNEESIKSLMQAQHKAVMKDLKKGSFDDKIDQYLGHVQGLEPRGTAEFRAAAREEAKTAAASAGPPSINAGLEITHDDLSAPIELPLKTRTATADRTTPNVMPPPPQDEDVATLVGNEAAALAAAFQASQERAQSSEQPAISRTGTAPKVSRAGVGGARAVGAEPAASIEIIDDHEDGGHRRAARDTTVEYSNDLADGVPSPRTKSEDVALTTPMRTDHAGHAPQGRAMSAPVVTRPAPPERRRHPDDSVVEIYQAAPASADSAPGERHERAGQYSVNRKSGEAPIREKTGRINAITPPVNTPPQTSARQGSGSLRVPSSLPRESSDRMAAARPPVVSRAPTPPSRGHSPPPAPGARPGTPQPVPGARPGTPQPIRAHVTAPIANRSPQPASPQPGSGVVMTRPAVIVGGPPKQAQPQAPQPSATTTSQRIRKAREDEGRGFGQGLISEKSLDEVILAYLSEDADDK